MLNNEELRYKIATIYLKEISLKGRYTEIGFLNKKAKDTLLSGLSQEDNRYWYLYIDSAKNLLIEQDLMVLTEKENFADLTEKGYKAAKYATITDYFLHEEKKKKIGKQLEFGEKIAVIVSAVITVVIPIIGLITKKLELGLLVAIFFAGLVIGFFIDRLIKRVS